ncbi:hypothetical protein L1D14_10655 [Vibrio tubiashii]|uniref:hypothetical protein n=1 Tax=Vibrio tubiashii TaxID=29498 RepID=UPI001EFD332B|nr:hypothetical protein [Vibrio tubiashii]MCG9576698.1 hypothetical protein [Vibrio tubiashii]
MDESHESIVEAQTPEKVGAENLNKGEKRSSNKESQKEKKARDKAQRKAYKKLVFNVCIVVFLILGAIAYFMGWSMTDPRLKWVTISVVVGLPLVTIYANFGGKLNKASRVKLLRICLYVSFPIVAMVLGGVYANG